MRYEGIECPLCKRKFTNDDNVVVCPQCGTPHHKNCYDLFGHCANEQLHSENFSYNEQNPQTAQQIEANSFEKENVNVLICPLCKHENAPGSEYCSYCGQKFTFFGYNVLEKQVESQQEENQNQNYDSAQSNEFFDNTTLIDGTNINDISEYVRNNSEKYIKKFRSLSSKKLTWNWAAFLFSPYWFFYRKLIKPGIIFLTAFLCLSIIFSSPINKVMDIYYNSAQTLEEAEENEEEMQKVMEQILGEMNEQLPYITAFIVIAIILKIVAALTADKLYKKRVINNINVIRNSAADSETFHLMMFKVGGVSILLLFISYSAEYLLSYLANIIMSM